MSYLNNLDIKGIVFNIQGFSIHDGPGIRTVVFLKGCPLRCKWCSNPESQTATRDILHRQNKCIKCYRCVAMGCPYGMITAPEIGKDININHQDCAYCEDMPCVQVCYQDALESVGKFKTIREVMDAIIADEAFYVNSGGGVTLSGGEPLMQLEFSRELFKECKKRYVHTAIETTGYAPWESFKSVLDYTDLVLFDIKHMDPIVHKELTGVSNELILKNAAAILTQTRASLIIRIPIIPGYNDSKENMEATARFINRIGTKEVNIIAYHRFGMGKYAGLGREYPLGEDVIAPTDERMKEIQGHFEAAYNLKCIIV